MYLFVIISYYQMNIFYNIFFKILYNILTNEMYCIRHLTLIICYHNNNNHYTSYQ